MGLALGLLPQIVANWRLDRRENRRRQRAEERRIDTGCPADVLHDPLRRRFRVLEFLSHLHSLVVTMSQKSSVLQAAKSVSQVLIPDKRLVYPCYPCEPTYVERTALVGVMSNNLTLHCRKGKILQNAEPTRPIQVIGKACSLFGR